MTSPSVLDSLAGFLKWGPTGLAGLMLVLVIIALVSGKLSPARERVLTKLMYIGGVCFFIALAATFVPTPGSAAQERFLEAQGTRHRAAMQQVVDSADGLIRDLADATTKLDKNCSGGKEGRTADNAPQIIALHNKVATSIAGTKASLAALIAETKPKPKP